jgi:hypothetical protein
VRTATKAVAGGIAMNLGTIALWALGHIPGWMTVPDEPKAAIIALVSTAIGAGVVYYAPANKEVVADAPDA